MNQETYGHSCICCAVSPRIENGIANTLVPNSEVTGLFSIKQYLHVQKWLLE